jgi:hypothetical protein
MILQRFLHSMYNGVVTHIPFLYSLLPYVSSIDAMISQERPLASHNAQFAFSISSHRTSAMPIAMTATPAPAALLATAAPVKVVCEKLLLEVALALSEEEAAAVGTTMLLDGDAVVVARATLCSERTDATPPADVATLGMPVMMPSELVSVV